MVDYQRQKVCAVVDVEKFGAKRRVDGDVESRPYQFRDPVDDRVGVGRHGEECRCDQVRVEHQLAYAVCADRVDGSEGFMSSDDVFGGFA